MFEFERRAPESGGEGGGCIGQPAMKGIGVEPRMRYALPPFSWLTITAKVPEASMAMLAGL